MNNVDPLDYPHLPLVRFKDFNDYLQDFWMLIEELEI